VLEKALDRLEGPKAWMCGENGPNGEPIELGHTGASSRWTAKSSVVRSARNPE
jgi:hypothetical protein